MARFTRRQRLQDPAEFRHVFANPARAGDHLVTVLGRANGRAYARLGMAVARRRIGRAVARNRFKRIVRESFRASQASLAGLDVVVLPKPAAATAGRAALRASIDRQWEILRQRAAIR